MRLVPIAVLVVFILSSVAWLTFEQEYNPLLMQSFREGDFATAKVILDKYPDTKNRLFIGNQDAPLTAVVYMPVDSKSAFFERTYGDLMEYVNTGLVRYYPRYTVVPEDFTQKTDTYWMMKGLACTSFSPAYETFYRTLFTLETKEQLLKVATELNILTDEWLTCLEGETPETMRIDIAEGKRFGIGAMQPKTLLGIGGRDNTIITGVPSREQLAQHIREYEVKIGR